MKKCGIYHIKNTNNGKFYIGSTIDADVRWTRHKYELNKGIHHCLYLQRSWDKHGSDAFKFCMVNPCTEEELVIIEQSQLDAYVGTEICYNISPHVSGGDIISTHPEYEKIIAKITEAVRKNMGKMTKEEKRKKWARYGSDNPNYGNGWSEKSKKEASERMKQRFRSPEERKKISDFQKKRFRNPEERKKISDFAKTRTGSKNPFYGKKHTKETKEKIGRKNLGRYTGNQEKPVEIDGVIYRSVSEAARQNGIGPALVVFRIKSKNKRFSGYRYVTQQ